jgi:signal peptidase I
LVAVFALSGSIPDSMPGVRAYKMTADSMLPTVTSEDRIVADTRYYRSHSPKRGDLIVFTFPYQNHPVYIKRVIGVPGDRVKIVDRQVYVNGQRMSEPYILHDLAAPSEPFGDNFPPHSPEYLQASMQPEWADEIFQYIHDDELTVPPEKYFTMGDNREHSWDSRYWGLLRGTRSSLRGFISIGPTTNLESVKHSVELSLFRPTSIKRGEIQLRPPTHAATAQQETVSDNHLEGQVL